MSRSKKHRRSSMQSSLRDRLAAVPEESEGSAAPAPVDETSASGITVEVVSAAPAAPEQSREPAPEVASTPRRPSRAARIAPHAARTASRARRTWIALLFFPVFAIYIVFEAMREVRDRLGRARVQDIERRPPFQRPAAMPTGEDRSVADIVEVLERFPFRPAHISTNHAFFRDNGADALGALLSPNPQIPTIPHLYPQPFRERLFTGEDGHRLAGMQAMHEHTGPAVIICHGLLMNKHFDLIVQLARRAFEQWGFHVVTLDLRGWGQSAWTTDAPASAGYHEGRDIIEVARELHGDPRVTSVAGIGFSLGGASMLNAAHASSLAGDRPLDGGAISVSPPTDITVALDHISRTPHWRDPFFGLFTLFQAVIRATVRRRNLSKDVRTWNDLVHAMSAPYYGVSWDEFCARASAINFVGEIDQPHLALHAVDDFVVPVQHAYALQDAAVDNPWVHVMVRDSGNHCSFSAVDPSWYHSTLRCWLEYWATPGELRPDVEDPAEDELVDIG